MMATTKGESQLERIIRDLQDATTELSREFKEIREPITDDSTNLHKFFYKLEYLLQFDLKEKSTLLGNKKEYWDYFCDCLAKVKGANDGIRFVKSISELKTSLGKGRAFLRYSLVHQRLADTLQQCFMNGRVTSDWYYARSPFLKSKTSLEIVGYLYELTEVQFDLASRGFDLDTTWPLFARRVVASPGAYMWKPPSRSSSMSSLMSACLQAQDAIASPEGNNTFESLENLDEMQIELDNTELRMKELEVQAQELARENRDLSNSLQLQKEQAKFEKEANLKIVEENARLTKLITELQNQHDLCLSSQNIVQELHKCIERLNLIKDERVNENMQGEVEMFSKQYISQLEPLVQELERQKSLLSAKDVLLNKLQKKLVLSEDHCRDLLRKADVLQEENTKSLYQEKQEQKIISDKNIQVISRDENNVDNHFIESDTEEKNTVFSDTKAQEEILLQQIKSLQKSLQDNEKFLEECRFKEETHKYQEKTTAEQLKLLEEQVSQMTQSLCNQEKEKNNLIGENEHFTKTVEYMKEQITLQKLEISELADRNNKLHFENDQLSQDVKRLDHKIIELQGCKDSLEADLAKLVISEKQSQNQRDDPLVPTDENKKNLLEKNQKLHEDLQNTKEQFKNMEHIFQTLQNEYQELQKRERQANHNLSTLQAEDKHAKLLISELQQNMISLKEKIKETEEINFTFQEKGNRLVQLANEIWECAKQSRVLDKRDIAEIRLNQTNPDGAANINEKSSQNRNVKESMSSMSVAEKHVELSICEMKRLQTHILHVRDQFNQAIDDRDQSLGKLDITEKYLSEHQKLIEQLNEQIHQQNLDHVEEIAKFKDREQQLMEEQKRLRNQKTELEEEISHIKDELVYAKELGEISRLEHSETEGKLQVNNTEMATLHTQTCPLTTERENFESKVIELTNQLQQHKQQATQEQESLCADLATVQQANKNLLEQLKEFEQCTAAMTIIKNKLKNTETELKSIQEKSEVEISSTKFQMSTDILNYQEKNKILTEELENVKQELHNQIKMRLEIQNEVTLLQDFKSKCTKLLEQESMDREELKSILSKLEGDAVTLREDLERKSTELQLAKEQIQKYSEKLTSLTKEKHSNDQRMQANIDDLNRTKHYLEERLIELIRDKDALWQKSDALEFEQKVREAERWMGDTEVNQCLDCKKHFNWMNRRHHCRLCGRIFCYHCCNNYVMTKHSDKKERCCQTCYKKTQNNNPLNSGRQEENSLQTTDNKEIRGVTVTEEYKPLQDTIFDIITDEEVSQVQDGATSQAEVDSLDQCTAELHSKIGQARREMADEKRKISETA
ncbi:FYVE and coiled-coil domain-containing protein 1 isoform 2-T2 [Discoglossus pictus]